MIMYSTIHGFIVSLGLSLTETVCPPSRRNTHVETHTLCNTPKHTHGFIVS